MRLFLVLVLVLFVVKSHIALSQNIIWESRLSWPGTDYLSDVVAADSGQYLAVGISFRYGFNAPSGSIYGLVLAKFDANGDTSFVRHLGGYYAGEDPAICRGENGVVYVMCKLAFTSSNLQIFKLDYDGNILSQFSLIDTGATYSSKIRYSKDGNLLITGGRLGSTRDSMRIIKANRIGLVLWDKTYSGGGTVSSGEYLEETPNGTYLASGTTSSNIWAIEVDSNGNQLRQGLLYRNSRNFLFTDVAVKSAPVNRFIATGNFGSGATRSYYFGSHNLLTSAKHWGGETIRGTIFPPYVNNDLTIVYFKSNLDGPMFTKIDADSNLIWQVRINSTLGVDIGVRPLAICYNSDSSAIMVGWTNDNNSNLGRDFYAARISGVGVPYDPTTPLATKPQLGSKGGISLWPQPSGGVVHFGGFVGPATVVLYDMKGQRVLLPTAVLPRQPLSIAHLPKGLYAYRLVAKDRVWTGKVVRE